MKHTVQYWIKCWSFYLGGGQPPVSWAERVRSVFGAFVRLVGLVLMIAQYLKELKGINKWLLASLGGSALLVFALPQSPMAQPWQ